MRRRRRRKEGGGGGRGGEGGENGEGEVGLWGVDVLMSFLKWHDKTGKQECNETMCSPKNKKQPNKKFKLFSCSKTRK